MSEEIREIGGADIGREEGVYEMDAVAGLFEAGTPEEPDGTSGEALPAGEENDGAEEGASAEAGKGQEEEVLPDIPMPEGWEESVWQGLAPEAKNAVNAREEAHAQAMAGVRAEQRQERKRQEAFAVEANARIQQALFAMRQIVEGEYGSVDWNGLAQSDPAAYVRLQQAYNARMGAIQRVQQGVAQQVRQYEAERAAEAQKALAAEFAGVQPELRALMGAGFEGKTFAADMAKYMQEQGCPPEVVNGLSKGYELKLIAKAMLYDRLQARRAQAAKKVAEAPRVQSPRGATPAETDIRARKAREMLGRNPDSTEALAALFEATM
ncbi:hypothetical protein [Mailhella massiliensis]|uniref:Uncharacterized protein n=1 Tax=Mailhella massiliensis TaxID=1903261 RepID=A0A921DRQ6_9BACT|nr:hypothetical protein [Mailhella massiliensis]HJD97248.1 hypothetical protein [Mailhella massiliensis]